MEAAGRSGHETSRLSKQEKTMLKNAFGFCCLMLLSLSLFACNNWNAEYPFKLGFVELHRGRDAFLGMEERNLGLTLVPDEDITVYGLRAEGPYIKDSPSWHPAYSAKKGQWTWQDGRFMPTKGREEGGLKGYPQMIKKGQEGILISWDDDINFEIMKLYTDKGTWLININRFDKNVFKAKKSNDKFDKEKNSSYKYSIRGE